MPGVARLLTPLVALLAGLSVACVEVSAGPPNYFETVEKQFSVSGRPTIDVSTFDGKVEVSTWDRPEVRVIVEKEAAEKSDMNDMSVDITQQGDAVRVRIDSHRERGIYLEFGTRRAHVTVTTPKNSIVRSSTGDGPISVQDVSGDISARTGDGPIRFERLTGTVSARTGDGSIVIDGAIAKLDAQSGDGPVRLRLTEVLPIDNWSVRTGDGSVTLDLPASVNADLDATTGDGRVNVSGLSIDSGEEKHRRSVRGRIGAGGGIISLRSGDGSITIRGDHPGLTQ